jgi:hypothetical protein
MSARKAHGNTLNDFNSYRLPIETFFLPHHYRHAHFATVELSNHDCARVGEEAVVSACTLLFEHGMPS